MVVVSCVLGFERLTLRVARPKDSCVSFEPFLQELHRAELRHGRDACGRGADTTALPPERGPNPQGAEEAGAYSTLGERPLAQRGAATLAGLSAPGLADPGVQAPPAQA